MEKHATLRSPYNGSDCSKLLQTRASCTAKANANTRTHRPLTWPVIHMSFIHPGFYHSRAHSVLCSGGPAPHHSGLFRHANVGPVVRRALHASRRIEFILAFFCPAAVHLCRDCNHSGSEWVFFPGLLLKIHWARQCARSFDLCQCAIQCNFDADRRLIGYACKMRTFTS